MQGKDAYEGVNEGTLHVSRVLLELKHLARTYHFHPLTEEERKERANGERYSPPPPPPPSPWSTQRLAYDITDEIKFGKFREETNDSIRIKRERIANGEGMEIVFCFAAFETGVA